MSYVEPIILAFGGVRALARAINRPVSTVGGWKDRGSIPDPCKPEVLVAAKAAGLRLSEADFFPRSLTNPNPLGPCQADEVGEQGAVGVEAGHGGQDACGLSDGQENAVSQMRLGVAHA